MDPLLRERIEAFLTAGHPGILSCAGPQRVLSLPVQYRVKGLRPADLFRFLPLQPSRIELVRGAPGQTIRESLDL